jgi:hypothetical protein
MYSSCCTPGNISMIQTSFIVETLGVPVEFVKLSATRKLDDLRARKDVISSFVRAMVAMMMRSAHAVLRSPHFNPTRESRRIGGHSQYSRRIDSLPRPWTGAFCLIRSVSPPHVHSVTEFPQNRHTECQLSRYCVLQHTVLGSL